MTVSILYKSGDNTLIPGVRLVSHYRDTIVLHFEALQPQQNISTRNVDCVTTHPTNIVTV